MPTTRTGRETLPTRSTRSTTQASSSAASASPSKSIRSTRRTSPQTASTAQSTRFSARLRSTSPYADSTTGGSAGSSSSSTVLPSISIVTPSSRASPRKRASPTKTSGQGAPRSATPPSSQADGSQTTSLMGSTLVETADATTDAQEALRSSKTSKDSLAPRDRTQSPATVVANAPASTTDSREAVVSEVLAASASVVSPEVSTSLAGSASGHPTVARDVQAMSAQSTTLEDASDSPADCEDSGDSGSDSSDSDTDTGSDDGSEDGTDTSDDSDSDEDGPQNLDLGTLLEASKRSYRERAQHSTSDVGKAFGDDQDVISFAEVTGEVELKGKGKDKAKDTQKVSILDKVRARYAVNGKVPSPSQRSSGPDLATIPRVKNVDKHLEALDHGKLPGGDAKTKDAGKGRETATAGRAWFDMPEFGASNAKLQANTKRSAVDAGKSSGTGGDARVATAEQLHKEVQAIRLRNALDPKRFYRGGAKEKGMPKYAQIGTIIASPLEPKAVLNRRERGRTVVEELIRDAEASAYAKRKFAESQERSASGRQGKGKRLRRHK
ncbi:dTDP-fucopyranose mutase [Thecaphora frezii]